MLVAEVRNWPPTLTSSYCVVNLLKEEIRQKGEQKIATTELKRSHTFFFTMISTLPYSRPTLFFLSKKKTYTVLSNIQYIVGWFWQM